MRSDIFRIPGPAIISFSGGRTSAYMLLRILQAWDGKLPPDVHVVFANTGREMPATLDFVQQCSAEWAVPVVWVEYRWEPGRAWAEVVTHNSASRSGEPFEMFLRARSALPNPVQRSCTQELKIRTLKRWVVEVLGWKNWVNVVGLRADEPRRVARLAKPSKERFTRIAPLSDANITKQDVLDFWVLPSFDLQLKGPHEGNCDGCFLKSRAALVRLHQDYPERMAWWATQEAVPRGTAGVNRLFRSAKRREPYADLAAEARVLTAAQRKAVDETMVDGGEDCADGGECVI